MKDICLFGHLSQKEGGGGILVKICYPIIGRVSAFFLFILLLLASCKKNEEPEKPKPNPMPTEATVVSVSLDFDAVQDVSKALMYLSESNGNKLSAQLDTSPTVPVCMVIWSDDLAQPVTYLIEDWYRVDDRLLRFNPNKDVPGKPKRPVTINFVGSNITQGSRRWYITGLMGPEALKTDKAGVLNKLRSGQGLQYATERAVVPGADNKFGYDAPWAFPWVELKISGTNNEDAHAYPANNQPAKFSLQGAFLKLSVTNKLNRGVRLNKIYMESSVFHNRGKFVWSRPSSAGAYPAWQSLMASDLQSDDLLKSHKPYVTGNNVSGRGFYKRPAPGVQRFRYFMKYLKSGIEAGESSGTQPDDQVDTGAEHLYQFLEKDATLSRDGKDYFYAWVMPVADITAGQGHTRVYADVTSWKNNITNANTAFGQVSSSMINRGYAEVRLAYPNIDRTKSLVSQIPARSKADLMKKVLGMKLQIREPRVPLDNFSLTPLRRIGEFYTYNENDIKKYSGYPRDSFFPFQQASTAFGSSGTHWMLPTREHWASILGGLASSTVQNEPSGIRFNTYGSVVVQLSMPNQKEYVQLGGEDQAVYIRSNYYNLGENVNPGSSWPGDLAQQRMKRITYALRYLPDGLDGEEVAPAPSSPLISTHYHLSAWRYEFVVNHSGEIGYVMIATRNLGFGYRDFGYRLSEMDMRDDNCESFWGSEMATWDVTRHFPLAGYHVKEPDKNEYYAASQGGFGLHRLFDYWAQGTIAGGSQGVGAQGSWFTTRSNLHLPPSHIYALQIRGYRKVDKNNIPIP